MWEENANITIIISYPLKITFLCVFYSMHTILGQHEASLVAQTVKRLPIMRETFNPWVGKIP